MHISDASKNKIYAVIIFCVLTSTLLYSTGTLMQTLLSVQGFSEQQIYLHSALVQGVNIAAIMLCSRWADTDSIIRRTSAVMVLYGLLFLGYIPLCFMSGASAAAFIILLAVSLLQSVTYALHTVCSYKLPYYIYKPNEYGSVLAISGILGYGASFGAGALMTSLSENHRYGDLMLYGFIISAVLMLTAAFCQWKSKSLIPIEKDCSEKSKEKVPLKSALLHPTFIKLLPANLFRGIANGTTLILPVLALSLGYSETTVTAIVSVQSVSSLLGCFLFGAASKKMPMGPVILAGSICFFALPLILLNNNTLFFVSAAILFFGRTLVDYAVPSALLHVVPMKIAGPFHAWRMILSTGGAMLCSSIAAFIPVPVILWATVALQMFSGISYLIILKKYKKDEVR